MSISTTDSFHGNLEIDFLEQHKLHPEIERRAHLVGEQSDFEKLLGEDFRGSKQDGVWIKASQARARPKEFGRDLFVPGRWLLREVLDDDKKPRCTALVRITAVSAHDLFGQWFFGEHITADETTFDVVAARRMDSRSCAYHICCGGKGACKAKFRDPHLLAVHVESFAMCSPSTLLKNHWCSKAVLSRIDEILAAAAREESEKRSRLVNSTRKSKEVVSPPIPKRLGQRSLAWLHESASTATARPAGTGKSSSTAATRPKSAPHAIGKTLPSAGLKLGKTSKLPAPVTSGSAPTLAPAVIEYILDGTFFDGKWDRAVINGNRIFWPSGRVSKFVFTGAASLTLVFENRTYKAQLLGGKLHWDDGDVWTRKTSNLHLSYATPIPQKTFHRERWSLGSHRRCPKGHRIKIVDNDGRSQQGNKHYECSFCGRKSFLADLGGSKRRWYCCTCDSNFCTICWPELDNATSPAPWLEAAWVWKGASELQTDWRLHGLAKIFNGFVCFSEKDGTGILRSDLFMALRVGSSFVFRVDGTTYSGKITTNPVHGYPGYPGQIFFQTDAGYPKSLHGGVFTVLTQEVVATISEHPAVSPSSVGATESKGTFDHQAVSPSSAGAAESKGTFEHPSVSPSSAGVAESNGAYERQSSAPSSAGGAVRKGAFERQSSVSPSSAGAAQPQDTPVSNASAYQLKKNGVVLLVEQPEASTEKKGGSKQSVSYSEEEFYSSPSPSGSVTPPSPSQSVTPSSSNPDDEFEDDDEDNS